VSTIYRMISECVSGHLSVNLTTTTVATKIITPEYTVKVSACDLTLNAATCRYGSHFHVRRSQRKSKYGVASRRSVGLVPRATYSIVLGVQETRVQTGITAKPKPKRTINLFYVKVELK
jgi:hypothetical protein